jgi:hypothetical protein
VAVWSKACACGRSLAGVGGSNTAGGFDVCRLLIVVCCQVEVSVMGRSLIQRSPTECCLSVCDHGTSLKRHWPTRGCRAKEKLFLFRITGILHYVFLSNRPT